MVVYLPRSTIHIRSIELLIMGHHFRRLRLSLSPARGSNPSDCILTAPFSWRFGRVSCISRPITARPAPIIGGALGTCVVAVLYQSVFCIRITHHPVDNLLFEHMTAAYGLISGICSLYLCV